MSTASFDRGKPEVDFPGGEPPTELVIEDLIVGEGRTAKSGRTVSAHYVGVAFSTGEEFDASWNRGGPLDFRLGVGQVIPGWDEGIEGMQVGETRQLRIPPELAYGPDGVPGVIPAAATLIFDVTLVSVEKP